MDINDLNEIPLFNVLETIMHGVPNHDGDPDKWHISQVQDVILVKNNYWHSFKNNQSGHGAISLTKNWLLHQPEYTEAHDVLVLAKAVALLREYYQLQFEKHTEERLNMLTKIESIRKNVMHTFNNSNKLN